MAIAANYRKHPEAMALQLVLVFTRFIWHTSRPTTRTGRAIRAAVGRAFKAAPKVAYPVKPTTPQWCRDLSRLARELGQSVKNAQICLDFAAPTEHDSYAEMIDRIRRANLPFDLDTNTRRALAEIPRQKANQTKLQHIYDVMTYVVHQRLGTQGDMIEQHMDSWLRANKKWMERDNILERHRLGTLPQYLRHKLAEFTG